jgi:hypothetical protein
MSRNWVISRSVSVVLVSFAAFAPIQAKAEAVSDWNLIGLNVMTNVARPGAAAAVDFAYMNAAIYDAVNAIDGRYSVYAVRPNTSPVGALPEAAVAAAAYTVLKALFPSQQAFLDSNYASYLLSLPAGAAQTRGIAVGTEVGNALLAFRAGDGRDAAVPYVFRTGPGQYQITPGAPPPPATPATPWVAKVRPFAILSQSQFRADGPPDLTSAQWAEDYNEVKAFGAATGSLRTPEQTAIGWFYTDAPVAYVNRNLRGIAASQQLSVADSARFFAQSYITVADTFISCWDSKYYYNFWRPVTAIRAGDTDGNDATEPDAAWVPLAVTPNHPEYPSAHGCLTGALAHTIDHFFGTKKITINMTALSVPGVPVTTHTFTKTQDMLKEVIEGRIYGGMHYRTSVVHGEVVANKVANWVAKHYFEPINKKDKD